MCNVFMNTSTIRREKSQCFASLVNSSRTHSRRDDVYISRGQHKNGTKAAQRTTLWVIRKIYGQNQWKNGRWSATCALTNMDVACWWRRSNRISDCVNRTHLHNSNRVSNSVVAMGSMWEEKRKIEMKRWRRKAGQSQLRLILCLLSRNFRCF